MAEFLSPLLKKAIRSFEYAAQLSRTKLKSSNVFNVIKRRKYMRSADIIVENFPFGTAGMENISAIREVFQRWEKYIATAKQTVKR